MRCNADRVIEALIAVELTHMRHEEEARQQQLITQAKPLVVTISRDYGAMGGDVAQLLADTLEVRCCNRFILQEVARRAHVDEKLVKVLDEHVSKIDGHWWQHLLHKETFSYEDYYHYLVKTVLSISRTGGVILGRGANMILGEGRAFRVRITGSPDKCAERISEREQIDIEQAHKRIQEVNNERAEYMHKLYDADITDASNYDLVLNSDRYDQVQMVELILQGMEHAGYKLPEDYKILLANG